MTDHAPMTAAQIRTSRSENPKTRDRDFAETLGLREVQLVAAYVGITATRIESHPDSLVPRLNGLGEVMALTRNTSCVIEKVGTYDNYRSGAHAAMVLTEALDLRFFPSHWVTAFAIEKPTDGGVRRSLQVFDAAGDAVHKIYLRDGSNLDHWHQLVSELAVSDQSQKQACDPRQPVEVAKGDVAKVDILRKEWRKMTDTHQFMRLTSKLKMNRLGAYRMAGAPFVRALDTDAVTQILTKTRDSGIEVMVFVGNRGCIEIHGGPIETLKPMGPWQNVLDSGFNLHLRADHVAEVWAVEKPTQRGMAISVEAFDAEGGLILQMFGRRTKNRDSRPEWDELVATLPGLSVTEDA